MRNFQLQFYSLVVEVVIQLLLHLAKWQLFACIKGEEGQ